MSCSVAEEVGEGGVGWRGAGAWPHALSHHLPVEDVLEGVVAADGFSSSHLEVSGNGRETFPRGVIHGTWVAGLFRHCQKHWAHGPWSGTVFGTSQSIPL